MFIKLWEHCYNDRVMFFHYMSFDVRINNKNLLNWTELKIRKTNEISGGCFCILQEDNIKRKQYLFVLTI